jgi:hypothetical protein
LSDQLAAQEGLMTAIHQAATIPQAFSDADASFAALKSRVASTAADGVSHGELERIIEADGREILRQLYQGHLQLRADSEAAEVIGADGEVRPHRRGDEVRHLMTIFGPVEVCRIGFARPGSPTLYPLDASLNLSKGLYSEGVRQRMGVAAASGALDSAVETVRSNTGARPAKRQAREMVIEAAADFEAFYEESAERPYEAPSGETPLVLTTDAKGVVMRPECLRPETRDKAAARRHKLDKRLSRGEKKNAKRMAQVASIYDIAPHVRQVDEVMRELRPVGPVGARPRPFSKRVWASLDREPRDVVAELFREAERRDPEHHRPWVALVDGNAHQLSLIRAEIKRLGANATIIIDIIHVLEYLWRAAHALFGDGSKESETWVQERFALLLQGRVSHVAAGLRRSATRRGLEGSRRKAADKAANYLLKYKHMMRYDKYIAAGYPIATGVIEGACRHLIGDRMDITGARWGLQGAEAVLKLRALRSSRDFDAYWRFHQAREHHRNHAVRYANEEVPRVEQHRPVRGRGLLRLVG